MSRIKYSPNAHLRKLQMSNVSLFAFVEGKELDSNFFGQVCLKVTEPRGISYRIETATELPGGSGGKARLIAFYKYARSKSKLHSVLNGKRTILLFFIDKDIDDLRRTKCRSQHVIYTKHYDVQNYIFRHGEFIRGVSAAASIDPRELASRPLFSADWCESAARRWREWTALCLFSALFSRVNTASNYKNVSTINVPQNGPLNRDLYEARLRELQSSSGLTSTEFDVAMKRVGDMVDLHLSRRTYDRIFKGKWYSTILEMDLRNAFADRGQMNNAGAKATTALLASLDFSGQWSEHLLNEVAVVVDKL